MRELIQTAKRTLNYHARTTTISDSAVKIWGFLDKLSHPPCQRLCLATSLAAMRSAAAADFILSMWTSVHVKLATNHSLYRLQSTSITLVNNTRPNNLQPLAIVMLVSAADQASPAGFVTHYIVSHKKTPPTFLAVTWTNIFWFQYFLAQILLRV